MTVHGSTLYSAWHSTVEIQVHDLPTESTLPSIFPEGYDTWVWGMAVTDDGLLALASRGEINMFDVATGAFIRTVYPVGDMRAVQGLSCVTKR